MMVATYNISSFLKNEYLEVVIFPVLCLFYNKDYLDRRTALNKDGDTNYSEYKAMDFIRDEKFVSWLKSGASAEQQDWFTLVVSDPDTAYEFNKAIALLSCLTKKSTSSSTQKEINHTWGELLTKITKEEVKGSNIHKYQAIHFKHIITTFFSWVKPDLRISDWIKNYKLRNNFKCIIMR